MATQNYVAITDDNPTVLTVPNPSATAAQLAAETSAREAADTAEATARAAGDAARAATVRNTLVIPPAGNHWYMGSDPFDAALLGIAVDGDLFTYSSGAQLGETYRHVSGSWTFVSLIPTPPASVATVVWTP